MKHKNAALCAIAAVGLMASSGQSRGRDPGPPDARQVRIGQFDRVMVAGAFNVTVRTGEQLAVSLSGPRTMLEDTELSVRDGRLLIGWQEGAAWSYNGAGGVDIEIALPSLKEAAIGDSGSIEIDRIEGDRFTAMLFSSGDITIQAMEVKNLDALLGGAGVLNIERLDAEAMDVKMAGSGEMRVKGRAANATLLIAGSGSFDNPQFIAHDADITVGGSGGMRATVNHRADIKSMGSGEISLTGGASCTVSKDRAGKVTCE